MLKKFLNKLKSFFTKPNHYRPGDDRSQPKVKIGDKVGNVTITRQYQFDKHTNFKVGESYRLGEAIVTLRASKEEVRKVLSMYEAKRLEKEAALRERGIELMLMSPEELQERKLYEWLKEREKVGHKLDVKVGHINDEVRYIAPTKLPPEGTKIAGIKQQFDEIVHTNALDKIDDKV